MPSSLPVLYTEAEAAAYLGIASVTLRRIRSGGEIAYIVLGKSPRYTERQILDYLEREI